jgi:hypothetical protein
VCAISFKSHKEVYFRLSHGGKTTAITFEARIIHGKHQSELIFAYDVLNKIRLSSLAYGTVSVHKCVTYVTNEVLTSRHDCVLERHTYDLDMPKVLVKCKLYIKYYSAHCYKFFISTYCNVLRNLTACF